MENMNPMILPNATQVLDIFVSVGPVVAIAAIVILALGLLFSLKG
jgi:hypothetical protein